MCPSVIALVPADDAEDRQRSCNAPFVTDLAPDHEAFFLERSGGFVIAFVLRDESQIAEPSADASAVAEFALHLKSLREHRLGFSVITLTTINHAQIV